MGQNLFVSLLLMAAWTSCMEAFNPSNIRCCNCRTFHPDGVAGTKPQVVPSPFAIKVDPSVTKYTLGLHINVNLTSEFDETKTFRSFMIKAIRLDKSLDTVTDEPIGKFAALDVDKVGGISECPGIFGSAFESTDYTEKRIVELVWYPFQDAFQGHVEFWATFIENGHIFWVREKSRPIYDPTVPLPKEAPSRYIHSPIRSIDLAGCGATKGCYRIPQDCPEIECEYLFTWLDQGENMEFEMSALTDGLNDRYFAVGLSQDIYMGDDIVFECVHNSFSGRVEVFQSLNYGNTSWNVRIGNPQIGITFQEGSYNNGRLQCRFSRTKVVNDTEISVHPMISEWYLLMARGPAMNGQILYHGTTDGYVPAVSADQVDLLGYDDISSSTKHHLVKAHACLMSLAWIFFAPIGLFWMKYYTTMWPNSRMFGKKYWFVVHAICSFWVILLVLIGMILIFFEAAGWSQFPLNLELKLHSIFGIIIFVSVLLFTIIALIRCPAHTCRPVGEGNICSPVMKWIYRIFWAIAIALAIPNLSSGMKLRKAMVPWWLQLIPLKIFLPLNIICEVILIVHQCFTHKKNKEITKMYELQKKEHPDLNIPEPWPMGRNFKCSVLFIHFIVCLSVVTVVVTVVITN